MQPEPRLNFVFIFDTSDNGSTFKNFGARVKLGSAVFLKVQKGGRVGEGGESPHSSESTLQSLHRALEFFVADHRGLGLTRLIYIVQKWLTGPT